MKGNKKILVVAVLLLLVVTTFTTYAIYRESVDATGSFRTANWSVKLDSTSFENVTNLTFGLSDLTCGSNPGKNNTIAPGAQCYIEYTIDALGSEVDVIVDAELDTANSTNVPTNMTLALSDSSNASGPFTIPYSTTTMQKTIRLVVDWPGATTDNTTKDGQDLTASNKNVTFVVKITASQALS